MELMTRAFWVYAWERAVKTTAQTALSLMSVDYVGVLEVDWAAVGSAAGLAAVLSILTSLTGFSDSAPDAPDAPEPAEAGDPGDAALA